MSCSRCWVHHLDLFYEPRIIILRRVSCRNVSTTSVLVKRQLINSPSGIYPVIREFSIPPHWAHLTDSSAHSQYNVGSLWLRRLPLSERSQRMGLEQR